MNIQEFDGPEAIEEFNLVVLDTPEDIASAFTAANERAERMYGTGVIVHLKDITYTDDAQIVRCHFAVYGLRVA